MTSHISNFVKNFFKDDFHKRGVSQHVSWGSGQRSSIVRVLWVREERERGISKKRERKQEGKRESLKGEEVFYRGKEIKKQRGVAVGAVARVGVGFQTILIAWNGLGM